MYNIKMETQEERNKYIIAGLLSGREGTLDCNLHWYPKFACMILRLKHREIGIAILWVAIRKGGDIGL